MVAQFEKLSEQEIELMLKAPILVCILIAGADGKVDKKEIREAFRIGREKKRAGSLLSAYFKEVSEDFEDKVMILLQSYPFEPAKRNEILVKELTGLNSIMKKLDPPFTQELYLMLKELAHGVASSTGGLLGYKSVGDEEARYVDLEMINAPH